MGHITYEGHGGTTRFIQAIDIQFDTASGYWVANQFVDRGGFTNVAHVPASRVYAVSRELPADESDVVDERFIDGRIVYDGPEGEETITVGGLNTNTADVVWFDDETDHWVVRTSRGRDETAVIHQYIPAHRVYVVDQRVDRGGELA